MESKTEKSELWRNLQPELFDHLDSLSQTDKILLLDQIKAYPPDEWEMELQNAKESTSTAQKSKTYSPPKYSTRIFLDDFNGATVIDFNAIDKRSYQGLWDHGLNLIGEFKTAVVILSGGQSSRFKSEILKGFHPVGPVSGKCLFQFFFERLLKLQKLYLLSQRNPENRDLSNFIPIYLMSSPFNQSKLKESFSKNDYFGYSPTDIKFFNQNMSPTFDENGRYILEDPKTLLLNPNGNGSIFYCLKNSGMLEEMNRCGIKYLHICGLDNLLNLVAYPPAFALMHYSALDILNICVIKENPRESIGVFCNELCGTQELKARVIEYSEISKEMSHLTDDNGKLFFHTGNICSHFFSLRFIEEIIEKDIMITNHLAHKAVDYYDIKTKQNIQSDIPNSYKLEKFIYDIFPYAQKIIGLELSRLSCFSPIKKQTGNDSVITAKADMNQLHHNWLKESGLMEQIDPNGNLTIEISPLTSYCGEGLCPDIIDDILRQ